MASKIGEILKIEPEDSYIKDPHPHDHGGNP
jgi:hypothetical protein